LLLPTDDQADLFGDIDTGPPPYVPDPRHVRNRLADMLAAMRTAERWPWEPVMVALYRETVWPDLCAELPDRGEAERWRAQIEAEAARLDTAGG
jgi:hypothetical protein